MIFSVITNKRSVLRLTHSYLFLINNQNAKCTSIPKAHWMLETLVKSNACTVNSFAPRHITAQYRNRIFWYYRRLF